MLRKLTLSAIAAVGLASGAMAAGGGEQEIHDYDFSFEGVLGKFDQNQLQRGLKVYTEVCSACHGLDLVRFGTLADEGGPMLPVDQVRAFAAGFEVLDKDTGDYRPATLADKFPGSAVEGAPDLSLMAKARAGFHGPYGTGINQFFKGMGGPEYIASLLTGYTGAEKEESGAYLYENKAFSSGYISMSPPLSDGLVEFDDGHANDVEHMAEDVAAFLMWTAEPKMMARKQAGLTGVLILSVLAALLYMTNKRLWAPHKGKNNA